MATGVKFSEAALLTPLVGDEHIGIETPSSSTDQRTNPSGLDAGRTGGRTITGGRAASENITIESTEDPTKGDVILNPTGGSVGIGEASPEVVLHVSSDTPTKLLTSSHNSSGTGAAIQGRYSKGTASAPTIVSDGNTVSELVSLGYDGTAYRAVGAIKFFAKDTVASTRVPGNLALYTATDATPSINTERMRIDSSGNIGMGTASQQTNVHIVESNTDTVPAMEIEQLSTGDAALQFSIVGDAYAVGIDNSDDDKFKISYASTAGTAALGTNDRLTIDSSGNVGIGTAIPSKNLHVLGNIAGSLPTLSGTTVALFQRNQTTNHDVSVQLICGTNASARIFLGDSDSGDIGQIEYKQNSNSLSLHTNSAERMRIDSSGAVGVGTTSPDSRLDLSDGALTFSEMTSPAAPAANGCVLSVEDNGAGKTRLMARFATGATQQVAIEP